MRRARTGTDGRKEIDVDTAFFHGRVFCCCCLMGVQKGMLREGERKRTRRLWEIDVREAMKEKGAGA